MRVEVGISVLFYTVLNGTTEYQYEFRLLSNAADRVTLLTGHSVVSKLGTNQSVTYLRKRLYRHLNDATVLETIFIVAHIVYSGHKTRSAVQVRSITFSSD